MSETTPAVILPDSVALPRPEHPRPDFQREPWINLNGRWRFTFDPQNLGEQQRWYRHTPPTRASTARATSWASVASGASISARAEDPFGTEIVVPFPWESHLSGVCRPDYKGAAWYQRTITVPDDWADADASSGPRHATGLPGVEDSQTSTTGLGAKVRWRRRPFLCFGAVDWSAKIWVNGRFVAEHAGGYTPFDLDISHYVRPGRSATLTVRVWDACDADTPLGKQTQNWYTHSGGIWQTVWLEGRAAAYLTHVHVTPDLEAGRATFRVGIARALEAEASEIAGPYRLRVASVDGAFPDVEQLIAEGRDEAEVEVAVPDPKPWSPESPHLYDCTVTLEGPEGNSDAVSTYFGLRSVARARWNENPFEYVLFNGEPVYLRGALDQAFHPEGLHTYPSDDAIRADIELAKELGLNMLRCHIKVNEPRYYYWADRLGLLVMYDLPSADIYTPISRAHWEQTFRDALRRDYGHPSIFAWILFNETWGLEEHQTPASWQWVRQMYDLAKTLDQTRLVEDNSACLYDHVKTDINTWHFYIGDYSRARSHVERVVEQTHEGSSFNYVSGRYQHVEGASEYVQGSEPFLNSEYAGLGASGGDKDISYSFKFLTTELRRHAKICGYVYTELSDIEWEHNGFVNYDRSKKGFGYDAFFPGMTVADLNGADFVGLDCAPCRTLDPGGVFSAPVFVSHWDPRPLDDARLCWRVTIVDRFGDTHVVEENERPVSPRRYDVIDAGVIEVTLPDRPCLATIAVWLEDGDGTIRARNYVNADVHEPEIKGEIAAPPAPERTERGWAVRLLPDEYTASSHPQPALGPSGSKFGMGGAGWVEYTVPLPENVNPSAVRGLRVLFEAGARTAGSRLGWRNRRHGVNHYPQTDEERTLPTDLDVSLNGLSLGRTRLPDDPADARGVLSLHLHPDYEFASYGFLTRLSADADTTRRVLDAVQNSAITVRFEIPHGAGRTGGLNLYGSRMGAFPVAPTLFLDLEP